MYEAKNSKICNFWTFLPVIQLINHLSQICKWSFISWIQLINHLSQICKWSFISWITGWIVQKLQILLFFASYKASILNHRSIPISIQISGVYGDSCSQRNCFFWYVKVVTQFWITINSLTSTKPYADLGAIIFYWEGGLSMHDPQSSIFSGPTP